MLRHLRLAFSILFCVIIHSLVFSQANNVAVTIGTTTVKVDELVVKDSSFANGQMEYSAVFSLGIRNGDAIKSILQQLEAGSLDIKPQSIKFTIMNFNYEALEERTYNDAIVEQLSLDQLDGASKAAANINMRIKSSNMTITPGKGAKFTEGNSTKSNLALASNFRLRLGTLPTNRVAKIQGFSLLRSTNGVDLTIEIPASDLKEWSEWLNPAKKGAQKRESGYITLLASNLAQTIIEFELKEVQILSTTIKYDDRDAIRRATISMRANSISIMK